MQQPHVYTQRVQREMRYARVIKRQKYHYYMFLMQNFSPLKGLYRASSLLYIYMQAIPLKLY